MSCKQIVQKKSSLLCNKSNVNEQSYCSLHDICFYPVNETDRCVNNRHGDGIYCNRHKLLTQCGDMVRDYKKVCKNETCKPRTKYQTKNDAVSFNKMIQDDITECIKKRNTYEKECIHHNVRSQGHSNRINQLQKRLQKCIYIIDDIYNSTPTSSTSLASPVLPFSPWLPVNSPLSPTSPWLPVNSPLSPWKSGGKRRKKKTTKKRSIRQRNKSKNKLKISRTYK
jgi:hypothetical protein